MSSNQNRQRPKAILTVAEKESLSDDMLRIWFSLDENARFSADNEGDYLKLLFPIGDDSPLLRTYTVARVNENTRQIAIDFVLHGSTPETPNLNYGGFAHYFAHNAKVGDDISAMGPNPKKSVLPHYNNILFVADATAIPALESVLRHAPVSGQIIAYRCSKALVEKLKAYGLPLNAVSSLEQLEEQLEKIPSSAVEGVWCAGEYQMMRAVRKNAGNQFSISRENLYFSSYWKSGMTEDGHKAFKQSKL